MNRRELYYHNWERKHDINEHLPYLAGLAHGKSMIVELGFRTGRSTSAFLFGDNAVKVIAFDINKCAEACAVFRGMTERFEFYQEDSLKVRPVACDILFIDSYHSYTQLAAELELHGPGAEVIVMHDTETFGHKGEDGKEPGLQQAIREFQELGTHGSMIHFPNNNGLTILRRV